MNDETFEIQKKVMHIISFQHIAHAAYFFTTAVITVAFFGIFLTYAEFLIVKIILICLVLFFFFISVYAFGRWRYYSTFKTYSTREHLAEIIEEIKEEGEVVNIYEIMKKLKEKSKDMSETI